MANVKVGDWVTSYGAGIWQVYRVLDDFYELRWDLKEEKKKSDRALVFSKRLFNSKWKRSLGGESCHALFVDPLDKGSLKRVMDALARDPKLKKAFEDYQPKSRSLVTDLQFAMPDTVGFERFTQAASGLFAGKIESGVTMDDILRLVAESELQQYKGLKLPNMRIQFFCPDHEVVDREFVFRSFRTLGF